MRLQIIAERRRAERAVTLSNQKFWRIPAVIAAQVSDDKLREGFHVLVNAVKILVLRFADGVAVARTHGINEDQIGFVEQTFGIVHELVWRGRRERAVNGVHAAWSKRAHVQ